MRRNLPNRQIEFRHEDGELIRTVAGADGRSYAHRCSLEVYEAVAWTVDQSPAQGRGLAINDIAGQDLPHTQVDVALAFMEERGIVERRHRRAYPATDGVHLDALVEWHALKDGAPVE